MYLPNYTDLQLFNPPAFQNQLSGTSSQLQVFRQALKRGDETLKCRFYARLNATEYVTQRAWLVDQILLQAWELYAWPDPLNVALLAVGGYGRGELHPASDVDVMILLEKPMDVVTQQNIENFLMFLWDIHLEIGHSVRALDECEQELNDITVITNLMEARLVTGPVVLFEALQKLMSPERIWPSKEFFASKIKEQTRRHLKYHDTSYNLEPNVKEGPGGLRDIQTIAWVAKRHFGTTNLYDLVRHNFLTEGEYQALIAGQEFIWQIRCMLHFVAGRHEDRLLFDYQRTLASAFGFHDSGERLGVENFMKQYYRTVKDLNSLKDMLLQLFQEVILYDNATLSLYPLNKRFQVRNDFIEATHDKVFMHYPFALLEIFLFMQQHREIKGVRASTIRLIRQYNWLIDDAFHRDLRSRSLFFEIVRQPSGITRALRRMNRYGVLGAYIPAFGRIVGQMQYDLFHVYTVDQHSLFVVRNLRHFSMPQYRHEFPLCSDIMATLPKPELLYLAGLFHDIAKGRGGDHSELGETEALNFCQAHGLSDYDARFVAWLVRNHLVMSTTAQRHDISDPSVINIFAQRMEDTTRLNYLYLLTVADIRATNPKLWNGWKDSLLSTLYHETVHVLQRGLDNVMDRQTRIGEVQSQTRKLLTDLNDTGITALWDALGDDYFLSTIPEDIARETRAILNHQNAEMPLILERPHTKGSTEFMFYLPDRDFLFADTTYYLEQKSLTIVDAYVVPTQTGYTIAGYKVLEEDGSEISDPHRVEAILQGLQKTLMEPPSSNHFYPINRRLPRQLKHFPVPTRITFSQDYSHNHTVLEVITTDRPGVLSRIGQAFVAAQVRLKKAKIATYGSRVEDIFFITDLNNQALYSADQLDYLSEQLSSLLDADIPKVAQKWQLESV